MATNFPDTTVNNPDTGRLWADGDGFSDPETGLIYYWYSPVWKTAISPTGTTDERYVEVAGDNMTGDLTLGPDGGPALIDLGATTGDITANDITANDITANDVTANDVTGASAEFAGDVQMASQNGGQLAGFRNLLINGDFRVWQRSNENVALAGTKYAADRWVFSSSATVNRTNQTVGNFPNAIRIQGGFDAGYLRQAVELPQAGQLGVFGGTGTTFTVSIYASTVPDIRVLFVDDNIALANSTIWVNQTAMTATGNSVSGTPTGTLNRYSITISNPPVLAGTNQCCVFEFRNAEYYTGAQLEPGPVATPFEHRPIGTELALCKRYFQQIRDCTVYTYAAGAGNYELANVTCNFDTQMRAAPSMEFTGDGFFISAGSSVEPSGDKNGGFVGAPSALVATTQGISRARTSRTLSEGDVLTRGVTYKSTGQAVATVNAEL